MAATSQHRRTAQHEAAHILVVDDDIRLRNLLSRFLKESGFRVSVAEDAAGARAHLDGLVFDLIVLDVMMPGEDGIVLTRSLRQDNDVPILLLTAMGESEDRITGLESGADDYLTKPFEPRELLLRIRTILRRVSAVPEARPADDEEDLVFGDLRFDPLRNLLWRGDDPIRLTDSEASLLRTFATAPGTVFSREDLVDGDAGGGNARTIDVQITRLRRKIEPDPKVPRFLQTVRGRGYVLLPGGQD